MSPQAPPDNRITAGVAVAALGGLALAALLIAYFGFRRVGEALLTAGWEGLGTMAVVHLVPLVLTAFAWRALFDPRPAAGPLTFIRARWIREGINATLAFLPLSGEFVGGRVLALHGVSPAAASVIVDMTCELLTQVAYAATGLAVLLALMPDNPAVYWAAAGTLITGLAFFGFIAAQIHGLFKPVDRLLDRIGRDRLGLPQSTGSNGLHDAVVAIYRNRRAILTALPLHFGGWMLSTVEAWVALHFMGSEIGLAEVLIIESVVFSWRSAAFFLPWNAGVQEGSYVLIGAALGLTPELGLALSLLKRGKELLLGIPAVLAWQFVEGGRIWGARASETGEDD